MRTVVLGLVLIMIGAAAGAWLPALLASESAEGPNVQCIHVGKQSVCKGQSIATLAASWDKLGGIVNVTCSYDQLGTVKDEDYRSEVPEIVKGCNGPRYVVDLNDGVVRTSLWIDNERIARIDRWGTAVHIES